MRKLLEPRVRTIYPAYDSVSHYVIGRTWSYSWPGAAVDPVRNRAWRFSGGGGNGSQNMLPVLRADRMQIEIEEIGSDPALFDPAYRQDFTNYPNYANSPYHLDMPGSVYPDRFPDGKPTARHVYRGMLYVPALDKVVIASRTVWDYDLKTRKWSNRGMMGQSLRVEDKPYNAYIGENIESTFDEVTGEVVFQGDRKRPMAWNIQSNTWRLREDIPWGEKISPSGSGARRGRHWWFLTQTTAGTAKVPGWWPPPAFDHDLDTGKTRSLRAAIDPRMKPEHFSGADGMAQVYVDDWDKFLWFMPHMTDVDGVRKRVVILVFDPTTLELTYFNEKMKASNGALPANRNPNVEGSAFYFPNLHLLVLWDSAEDDIFIMRTA